MTLPPIAATQNRGFFARWRLRRLVRGLESSSPLEAKAVGMLMMVERTVVLKPCLAMPDWPANGDGAARLFWFYVGAARGALAWAQEMADLKESYPDRSTFRKVAEENRAHIADAVGSRARNKGGFGQGLLQVVILVFSYVNRAAAKGSFVITSKSNIGSEAEIGLLAVQAVIRMQAQELERYQTAVLLMLSQQPGDGG